MWAQSNPTVSIQLYSGLTITGTLGSSYTVQYVTNANKTNNWQTLTNVVLTTSPALWVDASTAATADRFYRVIPTPATNAPAPSGMVLIPAGSFIMGDALDGEADAPTNTEYVSAFYMDTNVVTYSFWQQVHQWAVNNGYSFDNVGAGTANYPVQSVNWYDAVKWCNARSQLAGVPTVYYVDAALTQIYKNVDTAPYANWSASGYRLPTETEWEKAARGGLTACRFPWGNTISESQANYYGDPVDFIYDLGPAGYDPIFGVGIGVDTSPAGYFPPNGYGLYDMAGNVFNWCWDWYGPYATGVQSDPHGETAGSWRILRGGSWLTGAYQARTAYRNYYYPDLGDDGYGFRCVLLQAGQ